ISSRNADDPVAAITRNIPAKSAGLYSRASHSMRPSRAHSRTRGVAFGATTRTEAAVARRLSIFASPTDPAPTTRMRRPSSFTNMGNRLIIIPGATSDLGSRPYGNNRPAAKAALFLPLYGTAEQAAEKPKTLSF